MFLFLQHYRSFISYRWIKELWFRMLTYCKQNSTIFLAVYKGQRIMDFLVLFWSICQNIGIYYVQLFYFSAPAMRRNWRPIYCVLKGLVLLGYKVCCFFFTMTIITTLQQYNYDKWNQVQFLIALTVFFKCVILFEIRTLYDSIYLINFWVSFEVSQEKFWIRF